MARTHKTSKHTAELVKKAGDQALELQINSTAHIKKNFTRRLNRIVGIRRFVAGWLALVLGLIVLSVITLSQIYSAAHTSRPAPGGTYTEGMVGSINNLNPLFASGVLDESTSQLLFNGLMRHDTQGNLVPDLAKSLSVGEDDKTYTVSLRQDVVWQDGEQFTANDVVYTIKTIQDPATRSTQFSGWQGVAVSAKSKYEVTLTLPSPLASFADSLTLPIVPEHLLRDIQPDQLRTSSFNTNPVGTGPFSFQVLRTRANKQHQLELKQNTRYYRGTPKLDRFIIRTFADDVTMKQALASREITAAVGLTASSSADLAKDTSVKEYNTPLYSAVFAFFKTTNPILADDKVRNGLVNAVDRSAILQEFHAQYPPLKTPLLPTQLGFSPEFSQKTNLAEADKLLTAAGWVRNGSGVRTKDGVPLKLSLVTVDSPDQVAVVKILQKQWLKIGVSIQPQILSADQLQDTALATHDYDILLYGISIDHDPDVYAYWHSSQAKPGANNFSEWKSPRADVSLGVARSRLDPVLRIARYRTFQDEWLKSAPAVALYQLQTTYVAHQNAAGFVPVAATNAADRLINVESWTVNTSSALKTP